MWIETGIYGAVTVKPILEGRHVKLGVEAHLTTLLGDMFLINWITTFFHSNKSVLVGRFDESGG